MIVIDNYVKSVIILIIIKCMIICQQLTQI